MVICLDMRTGTGCGATNHNAAAFCQQCGKLLRYALTLRDPGSTLGPLHIIRVLGYGNFGVVYEIEDRRGSNRLALKETFDADSIRSFKGEFEILKHLHHPNLPRYYDMFEADGNGYLLMEFVPGQSLEDVLDRQQGPLLESQVLGYALQLCDALIYLHQQSPPIIHRDIKPANVRLTPEGLIKLVDFGLLKQGLQQTQSSRRGLTPVYAPIEQYGAQGLHTDPRSDLYSLGAMLYHLLTGQEPLPATDRIASQQDRIQPILSLNPSLSKHVGLAVYTAMELLPERRYPDVVTFKQALQSSGMALKEVMPSHTQLPQPQAQAHMRPAGPPPAISPVPVPAAQRAPVAAVPVLAPTIPIPSGSVATPALPSTVAPTAQLAPSASHRFDVDTLPGVNIVGLASAFVVAATVMYGLIAQPMVFLLAWVLTFFVAGYIYDHKGGGWGTTTILTILLGPLAVPLALLMMPRTSALQARPPYRPRLLWTLGTIAFLSIFTIAIHPAMLILGWATCATVAGYISLSKGRPGVAMFFLGVFLGPLAILIAGLIPSTVAPHRP